MKDTLISDTDDFKEFIDLLTKIAIKEQVEIEYSTNPEGKNITIRPWKPFSYNCPYLNIKQEEK